MTCAFAHRIAVFIRDAAANHGRSLQANLKILQLLAFPQSQHAPFGAGVMFFKFEESGLLGE